MQKKYLAIAAAVILSAGLTLTAQLSPNPHTIYTRRLPELTQTVETLLENPNAAQPDIPGVQSVTYWDGENPIIEFTTCTSGIVPSSGIMACITRSAAALPPSRIPTNPLRVQKTASTGRLKAIIGAKPRDWMTIGSHLKHISEEKPY